ncbi:hypothetical protein LTR74_017812 [Friedmanniomyces endolithicus]|nr:hypothetical protein LTR74_017812 [Friedmanniomyces endolithicus]
MSPTNAPSTEVTSIAGNKAPKHQNPDCCVSSLKNPLLGIEKPQLFEQVTDLANECGLTEVLQLLKKGALVAQKPHAWDAIEELDEDDNEHLRRETSYRWSHPRMLYFLIVLSSIGAAVQGWDQTGKAITKIVSAIMSSR